ncbi:MAG: hypothetical protein ABDH23_00670 [Endomicrobiia bacterium]
MKNCKKTEYLIWKKLDGSILTNEEALLDKHLEICDKCRSEYILNSKIKENLKEIKYQEIPPWFKDKLHQKLVEVSNVLNHQEFIRKVIYESFYRYAVALGLVLVAVVGLFFYVFKKPSNVIIYSSLPQLTSNYEIRKEIPVGKESYLRLKVTSKRNLKNVKIQILLPPEISGEKKPKVVNWEGDLNTGDNYIILKVKSIKEGQYPLEIKLRKNSREKKFIRNVKISHI